MDNLIKTDKLLNGILLGILTYVLCYFTCCLVEFLIKGANGNSVWLFSVNAALITLALNMILFRFMVVKWKKTEIAKGMFMSYFVLSLVFVFLKQYYFKTC
jgi:hypothetical protein